MIFDPAAPLEAIRRQFPRAEVDYDDGSIPERAANAAAGADAAIVFVDQWMTETADAPDLSLPDGQDRLVEAVARANPRTAVVLETGGPVLMPWIGETAAVLEAWYPGQQGGEAIAEILSGAVNPSGRLPVTFPDSETQLPHPRIQGDPNGAPIGPVGRGGITAGPSPPTTTRAPRSATNGSSSGRAALVSVRLRPLVRRIRVGQPRGQRQRRRGDGERERAQFRRPGRRRDAPALRIGTRGREHSAAPGGLQQIDLAPGEDRRATVSIDPRLLATFDETARRWRIARGEYRITAGFDAERRELSASFALDSADLPP